MKEYEYVLAVWECGNISRAAEALYISQPSLSIYLKNLEQRLGIRFFEKVSGRLIPTPEGELYLEYGRKIIGLNQELGRRLDNYADLRAGVVRIGVTPTSGAAILPRLLADVQEQMPGVVLRISEAGPPELERMVNNRELDFILVNHPFKEIDDLSYELLANQDVLLVVPQKNPLCQKVVRRPNLPFPLADIDDYGDEKFILLKKGQRLRAIADAAFEKAGFNPTILFETS